MRSSQAEEKIGKTTKNQQGWPKNAFLKGVVVRDCLYMHSCSERVKTVWHTHVSQRRINTFEIEVHRQSKLCFSDCGFTWKFDLPLAALIIRSVWYQQALLRLVCRREGKYRRDTFMVMDADLSAAAVAEHSESLSLLPPGQDQGRHKGDTPAGPISAKMPQTSHLLTKIPAIVTKIPL